MSTGRRSDGISILLPTRGRPDNVERLVQSAEATVAAPTRLEFVFYVDDDDHATIRRLIDLEVRTRVRFVIRMGPRRLLSECWNECARHATNEIMMHCGDDIVFRSADWDQYVREVFDGVPDKIALVHGRDGFQDGKLATHGFTHVRWMDTVGYFVPPYFASDYNDTWLTEVADSLARRWYLPEVFTEHMHPVAGKGEWDVTHQERIERHRADDCDEIWRRTAPQRVIDIEKLRAVIDAGA